MNARHLSRKFTGVILGFTLLLTIGVASNVNGQDQDRNRNNDEYRQDRNWERYGTYGGSSELRQTALNAGYNEGVRESLNSRNRDRRVDYRSLGSYQRASKDYSPRLGDRELYRRYFREAFENGYNGENLGQGNRNSERYRKQNRRGQSDDGYTNFGGSFQLRQTALNAGFAEGVKQGRSDRSRRNGNGYQNQNTYQKATKDYSSRLGDREVYRRYFREAYEHGYDDGINGY